MKKLILISFCLIISNSVLFAQPSVVEIKKPEISDNYLDISKNIDAIIAENPTKALELLNNALDETDSQYERFNLIFWGLSFAYAEQGDYKNCLDILLKGQDEGLYYPIWTGQRLFPSYAEKLQELDNYETFIKKNEELKLQDQSESVPEYIIELPENYSVQKSYPLFISFTGGFGSHIGLSENWHSSKLKQEFIVAHFQGSVCQGSFLKSYGRNNLSQLADMYNQIIKDYPVDTTQIILGAQSAGTYFTLKLAIDGLIPVKGISLAFPHIPRNLDFLNYQVLADKDVRISIMGGEFDFRRIVGTKEMSVNFDKNGIKNRLIIFSEKGHEFPDDFPHQLDLSIDFINTP